MIKILDNSENVIFKFLGKLPIASVIIKPDGSFLFTNDKWQNLFQTFDLRESNNLFEFFPSELARENLTSAIDGLCCRDIDLYDSKEIIFSGSGNNKTVKLSAKLIDNFAGNQAVQIFFQDISEQEQFKDAYKNLVEHSFQAVLLLQDFRIVFANKKTAEITGFSVMELMSFSPREVRELIHPDDKSRLLGLIKKNLRGGRVSPKQEFRGIKKDGSVYWLEILATMTNYNGRQALQVVQLDVSEKKRAEAASINAEDKFKKLVEQSLFGIYIISGKVFTYVNPKFAEIFGYKQEEISHKLTPKEFVHPADWDIVKYNLRRRTTGILESIRYNFRGITKEGKVIYVEVHGSSTVINGKPAVIGTLVDITRRKQNEETLKLQSEALNAAGNGILITDYKGRIVYTNSSFTKLTGYSYEEAKGKNPNIFKSGIHDNRFYEELWKTILSGKVWEGEIINKRKNGDLYSEYQTITPVTNDKGKITNYIAIKSDITIRKKAENALKESEERFRGLYENSLIGIYRTTPEGEILMANPALLKMLGYESLEEFRSLRTEETLYENIEIRKQFQSIMKQFGEVKGFETTAQRKDGANFYIRESARAVKDKFGNISYYEGTIENINSSKEAEKALIEAKEEAEKSDKLKSEFLAQMSHEIRTPINVILSFSNLIKDEVKSYLSDELVNSFGIIDNAARRTMRTIDLMLNMSQIQTGSYYLKKKKIDLYTDILLEIKPEFAHLASEKNLQFDIELAHDNPVVEADHYSVTKIFDNLIHNAIKYTNDGYVKVIIDKTEDDKIIASVKDSGIGIAEEYLPMLFQPFSQEEHGYTRKYEGNGLGLALVKKYCDMNNLNIEVQSKKDEGTEFKVYFK